MKVTEKLLELGFGFREDYFGNEAYVYKAEREDGNRFTHDFVYYPHNNKFYINCYFIRGLETISEADLLRDHNELNTPAKEVWLDIKGHLEGFEFSVYEGVKCFADDEDTCTALTEKKCQGCNFFQTKSMVELSRARAMRRFKKLPLNYRYRISEKYKEVIKKAPTAGKQNRD